MASRKPNLTLPLPVKEHQEHQRSTSSLRSPRFVENFDAPFSEAIMNASRTTLATDSMTYPSSSANDRASFGDDATRRPSFGTKQGGMPLSPTPLRERNSSWESETKRRATINERIREWARKSWGTVRSRPDTKGGYFESNPNLRWSNAVLSPSSSDIVPSDPDGCASNDATNTRALRGSSST